MTPDQIVFLIVAFVTLSSGLMVVTTRNLVHAALWLVATLFGVAVTYALLNANFLAIVQVVVYIGAIAILWVNMIMDGPPAMTLGIEPARPGIMQDPPRRQSAQILTDDLNPVELWSEAVNIEERRELRRLLGKDHLIR